MVCTTNIIDVIEWLNACVWSPDSSIVFGLALAHINFKWVERMHFLNAMSRTIEIYEVPRVISSENESTQRLIKAREAPDTRFGSNDRSF